jgi:hypothetical protein
MHLHHTTCLLTALESLRPYGLSNFSTGSSNRTRVAEELD